MAKLTNICIAILTLTSVQLNANELQGPLLKQDAAYAGLSAEQVAQAQAYTLGVQATLW